MLDARTDAEVLFIPDLLTNSVNELDFIHSSTNFLSDSPLLLRLGFLEVGFFTLAFFSVGVFGILAVVDDFVDKALSN